MTTERTRATRARWTAGAAMLAFVIGMLPVAEISIAGEPTSAPGAWHTDPAFAWVTGPGDDAAPWTDRVDAFLSATLSDAQIQKTRAVLGHADAWGALGPNAPAGPPRPEPPRPTKTVTLDLPKPGTGQGSGTTDDPWRGVLGDFLADYAFPEHDIEAYASYPKPARLEAYLDGLAYEPVTVKVPAGHYREWSLDVPPGVWLVGVGKNAVHISPDPPDGDIRGALIELRIAAGLENIHLDGSNIPGFEQFHENVVPSRLESAPQHRVHGVLMHHGAWVVDCRIRNFTHSGIRAAGSRGRRGSFGTVVGNIIENIGYSGVSAQSRWLIQDNELRHCGYLRPTGAGDDPIIPRWGVETAILNNFVLNGRGEIEGQFGRHVISGQTAHRCLVAGNISIADGSQRNNIQFSDGSHHNRFVGNLTLATATTNSAIQAGVGANGFGNIIEYNVSLMNPQGFRPGDHVGRPRPDFDPDDPPTGYIRYNYAEYRRNLLHWMVEPNVTVGNEGKDIGGATLELIDPEKFGFFRPAR